MFRQLLWKEWREQRWKLIFGTVMLLFFTGTLMAARLSTSHEVLVAVWIIGGLVLALYSAMGVFAPEVSNETQTFLMSKPITPLVVFWGKWFMGWLNFAVPMLVCSMVLAAILLFHPESRVFELKYIARGSFAGVGFGTMFYTMTCCFAPRSKGEAAAAVTGLVVCVIFILYLMIIMATTAVAKNQFSYANEVFLYLNPIMWINFIKYLGPNMHLWILVVEQLILFVLTVMYGYRRWQRS
jgi:ABC-type transport system involved in multi-copper enzyme maturation permease subunit